MTPKPIRVLVIDDSVFSRQTITRMLRASPLIEVVGIACDGEQALRQVFELKPDLVTLDLEMPKMDGFTVLRIVMSKQPTPVIVVSGRAGESQVFKALELGAVDFVAKPTPHATPMLASIGQELIRKVHAVRELRVEKLRERIASPPAALVRQEATSPASTVVAIGASTGGPAALMQIFKAFPAPPPCAFLVAQHMPKGFTSGFAERLDRLTALRAREAKGGERPAPGEILVAPGGRNLVIESVAGRPSVRVVAPVNDRYTPSVDRLFESAAKAYGASLLAIVLTGMGDDGALGVSAVQASGGSVIAESEETAVVFGMPRQAIRSGAVDCVLPLDEIAGSIQRGLLPKTRTGKRAAPVSAVGRGR